MTNDSTGDGVGQVSWLFAANNVLRQSLGAGQVLVQTYTVVIDDGHGGTASQLVTITINGTNDAAVITGDTTGAVVEAGGVANAIPGTPTVSGNLDATDVDDPPDSWRWSAPRPRAPTATAASRSPPPGCGATRSTTPIPTVQALPAGGTLTDSFTVATIDGTEQVVTITITGTNDAPVAVADSNAGDAVTESGIVAGDPSAAGNVLTNDTDVDTGDTRTVIAVNGSAPTSDAVAGRPLRHADAWRRRQLELCARQRRPRHRCAGAGPGRHRRLHLHHDDANGATATAALTITITGTNDAPVVTGAVDTGTVTEGSLPVMVADGTIDFGDVDLTDAHVTSVTPGAGGYLGTFVGGRDQRLDRRRRRAGDLAVRGQQRAAAARSGQARCWCRPIRS